MSYPQGQWTPKGEPSPPQLSVTSQALDESPRRVGSGDQSFIFPGGYSQNTSRRGNVRQSSASPTSSLSGAMGDAHISPNPQLSTTVPSGMTWPLQNAYPDDSSMDAYISAPPTPASSSPSGAFSIYPYPSPYNASQYSHSNTEGFHNVPSPLYSDQFQAPRAISMLQARSPMSPSPTTPSSTGTSFTLPSNPMSSTVPISGTSRSAREPPEEQIHRLQQKIRELELAHDVEAQRARHLEQELTRVTYDIHSGGGGGALPSPLPTPTYPPAVEENWRARTEARKKIFCSVNRAGNALCAWHDSRRERRVYPPRNAPPGYLNCGCTYDQALFEESLARHHVGSYHPGESVRMDPALRNPLLQLLQERYAYRDGDFDFDPVTQTWKNGEDAAHWERKLAAGAANTRRARGEDRR